SHETWPSPSPSNSRVADALVGEAFLSADHSRPRPSLMTFGVIGLVAAVVAAYVASVALYASSGGHHHPEIPAGGDRSAATLIIEDIQSDYSVLTANLSITPGSALLDPQTQHLNEDLSLRVRSVATPTRRTWTKGMLPGIFPVPL